MAMTETDKQETLEIFGELLGRLWERVSTLIGETATVAVFRSALLEASHSYAFLHHIQIEHHGLCLEQLKEPSDTFDRTTLRSGLLEFTDCVMALLIDLTGEILLRKVEPLVQQYKQKLDKS